jgi:hypothetical protein
VVALVAWGAFVARTRAIAARNAAAEEAKAKAISEIAWYVPETDDPVRMGAGSGWRYDLRTMLGENWWVDFMNSRKEDRELLYTYHLRRLDGPEWHILLTHECYEDHKKRLATREAPSASEKEKTGQILDSMGLSEVKGLLTWKTPQEELKALWEDTHAWRAAPPEHQGQLEHRYQQLLRVVSSSGQIAA